VSYRTMSDEDARAVQPVVVHVDALNRIV